MEQLEVSAVTFIKKMYIAFWFQHWNFVKLWKHSSFINTRKIAAHQAPFSSSCREQRWGGPSGPMVGLTGVLQEAYGPQPHPTHEVKKVMKRREVVLSTFVIYMRNFPLGTKEVILSTAALATNFVTVPNFLTKCPTCFSFSRLALLQ